MSDFMKYPKINTIWKRDENNKFKIIEGDVSCPEFDAIKLWHVTEKIDGTNIRVFWNGNKIEFGGREDNSNISAKLLAYLMSIFTIELMQSQFQEHSAIIFGEGYGGTIQKAGKSYREDMSFILFDAYISGWWLQPNSVKELASQLSVRYVPELGIMEKDTIVDLVKNGFNSHESLIALKGEGVVARSEPLMLFRDGTPIMWKLKHRDYK